MSGTVDRATTRLERPAFFSAAGESLFGIVTEPVGAANGNTVISISGGAYTPSTGRNRFSVQVCRRLAEQGFRTFRFDYHGIGESTGVLDAYRLDAPFVEDLVAAAGWLEDSGSNRLWIAGRCFGARTALAAADRLSGLKGLVLLSPPVRDFKKGERGATRLALEWSIWDFTRMALRPRTLARLFRRDRRRSYGRLVKAKLRAMTPGRTIDEAQTERWASANFLRPLSALIERRVPILFVFGTKDDSFADFQRAKEGRLGRLLEQAEGTVEVLIMDRRIEDFVQIESQDPVADAVRGWIVSKAGTGEASPGTDQ